MNPIHDDAQIKLSLLEDIAGLIDRSHDLQATFDNIVRLVAQRMRTDVCSIYLWDEAEKALVLKSTVGLHAERSGSIKLKLGEGLTTLAIERLQPVMTSQASRHPRYRYFPEIGEEEFDTFLGVPLLDRGAPIGVIVVQSKESRPITPNDVRALSTLATQLTAVVRNATILDAIATNRGAEYLQNLLHSTLGGPAPAPLPGPAAPPPFLRGKAVGRGLAMGVAHVVESAPRFAPRAVGPEGIEAEIARLGGAVEASKNQIRRVQREYAETFSEELAGIFTTHLMILEDEAFLERIRRRIREGVGAEQGVQQVLGQYVEQFSRIEDPYLRERVFDLKDIGNRLYDNLGGRASVGSAKGLTGRIVFLEDLTPSGVVQYHSEEVEAVVSEHGGATGHAAILAESLQIPMILGVSAAALGLQEGDPVIVDGNQGLVYARPNEVVLREYERARDQYRQFQDELVRSDDQPTITTDGQRIHLFANIGFLTDLKLLDRCRVEGIGLYRTEFPFLNRLQPPSEAEQVEIYSKVIDWAGDRPVCIRVLDIAADKRLPYLPGHADPNPALGLCSIRLALAHRDLLRTQLRAVLRVGASGNVRLLLPLVTRVEEVTAVQRLLAECRDELMREGLPHHLNLPLGIMVETPGTVLALDRLAVHVDFLSVGTNDLIQYTLAVDRNNERVGAYYDPLHPAILTLLGRVIEVGQQYGKEVTVCGEMAGDPGTALLLIGLGLGNFSMNPAKIPLIKRTVRAFSLREARQCLSEILVCDTLEARAARLRDALRAAGLVSFSEGLG